jgi:hypothetical protein
MKKVKQTAQELPDEGIPSRAAVKFLQEALPEKKGYWASFLVNNRRTDRNPPHRIPFGRQHGEAIYRRSDLRTFIEFEKRRRLTGLKVTGRAAELMQAYGIGSPTGGPYGRTFDYHLLAQSNESGPHGQLIINEPLLVFHLPPDQVNELADAFASLARELKEISRYE